MRPAAVEAPPAWDWKPAPWILVALAVLCGAGFFGTLLRGPGGKTAVTPSAADAERVCQDFVRDRLPGAQFAGLDYVGYPDDTYTVSGAVDTQNGRQAFECKVQMVGGVWNLVSLTGVD